MFTRHSISALAFFVLLCITPTFVGCEVSIGDEEPFTAIVAYLPKESVITKTTLTRTDSGYKIAWDRGDEVSINGFTFSVIPDPTNSARAYLRPQDDEVLNNSFGYYLAFYPASIFTEDAGLPSVQTYAPNSIHEYPMCAYSISKPDSLKFHHLCGVLRLRVHSEEGSFRVTSIEAQSNRKCLYGTVSVNIISGQPYVSGPARNILTLDCGEKGVTVGEGTPTIFDIVVPAAHYANDEISLHFNALVDDPPRSVGLNYTIPYGEYIKTGELHTATLRVHINGLKVTSDSEGFEIGSVDPWDIY